MTHHLAVMGNPIAHSLSPGIHYQFAAEAEIDISYEKILVPNGEFEQFAAEFFNGGGIGLNVTVPHKSAAFEFATDLSSDAAAVAAVNTLLRNPSGDIRGENTDGIGLLNDIERNLGWDIKDKRVLILGAGGAVQGVIPSLLRAAPNCIVLANRTYERAEALAAKQNDDRMLALPISNLSEQSAFDVIVSASSAGLSESEARVGSFLPDSLKANHTCCYDMIYGKPTEFLRWAEPLPFSQRSDGLGMLVEQAARSFELWFGVKVSTQPVLEHVRAQVNA